MEKLLILGSSIGVEDLIHAASEMGVHTIVTDYLPVEKSIGKQLADEYWMISTAEVDVLEQKCRNEGITAVFAPVSEFNLDRTLDLCERLGLPFYSDRATWHYDRSKADVKKVCREIGVPVAEDYYLSANPTEEELSAIRYPVVVKANDLCGNQGMSYCYDQKQLLEGYQFAASCSDDPAIIVERMLIGREYFAYYALAEGEMSLISFIEMHAGDGQVQNLYCIDTSATGETEKFIKEMDPLLRKLFRTIGCREGVIWVEMILDQDDRFHLLEIGYRMQGDLLDLTFPELMGFDPCKWMLNYALGRKNRISDLPDEMEHMPKKCVSAYTVRAKNPGPIAVMNGIEEIRQIPGVVYYPERTIGEEVPCHRDIAIITIIAEDCDEMCSKIDRINRTLVVLDEDGRDMCLTFTNFDLLRQNYDRGLLTEDPERC